MRKVFFHHKVVELCTSIQEGLPLVATEFIRVIVEGVLAAAAHHYPVIFCGYVVMRNHIHILLIIQDPAQFPSFVGYLKTELAHAINSLLGTRGKSVWIPDFDSPVIMSSDKMLERMNYLYLNPVRANLVDSIANYPGVSSFPFVQQAASLEPFKRTVKKVARNAIPCLPKKVLLEAEQRALANELRSGRGKEYTLSVSPWAWLDCFADTRAKDPELLRVDYLTRFFQEEQRLVKTHKTPPAGAERLRTEDPRKPYTSARNGRKSLCLSSSPGLRSAFADWYNEQIKLAKVALHKWWKGDFSVKPPPGFYLPGGALLVCALFPTL